MAHHPQPSGTAVATRLGPLNVRVTGAGPTALLWHSLFVDSATWGRIEQPLAAERRLLLVDGPLPRHKPADHPAVHPRRLRRRRGRRPRPREHS
jgi:hypothetical protein